MTEAPLKRRDRRIERTHQLLSNALMELIVERGYDSITIQDITDRANVSRTTFYLHFKDKDELLFNSMQAIYDGLISNHGGLMKGEISEDDFDTLPCDASDFIHVAEYADFYRAMLSQQGSAVFILRVMSYLADMIKPTLIEKGGETELKMPPGLIAAFLAGAEVGVMKWWIEQDMAVFAGRHGADAGVPVQLRAALGAGENGVGSGEKLVRLLCEIVKQRREMLQSEPVSNRTRTSNTDCAASGRQARVRGFRREAARAATGTPGDQPRRVHLQEPPRVPP